MQEEPNQTEADQPDIGLNDIDTAVSSIPSTKDDVPINMDDYVRALARVTEEKSILEEDIDRLKKKVKTTEILDELIEPYAKKAFYFMCSYCGFVGATILANANGKFVNEIPPSVLEFLVGSTAVTVIGLVGMVLTGIFIGARK